MLCVLVLLLMRVSVVGRLGSLAAIASLGALLELWTSYAVCLHDVTDAHLKQTLKQFELMLKHV